MSSRVVLVVVLLILHRPLGALDLDRLRTASASKAEAWSIKESGYLTSDGRPYTGIYWLDNHRILFLGRKAGDTETAEDGRVVARIGGHVWDLRTGHISEKIAPGIAELCYDGGHLQYLRQAGTKLYIWFAGNLDTQAEVRRFEHGKPNQVPVPQQHGWMVDLSCDRYSTDGSLPSLLGPKVGLRAGHGFLFFGGGDPQAALQYYTHGSWRAAAKPLVLALRRWEINPFDVTPAFDGSYILKGFRKPQGYEECVPEGAEQKVYRLWPDGRIEGIVLPALDEIRCSVMHPHTLNETRAGITITTHSVRYGSYLYLLKGRRVQVLSRGPLGRIAVSPDGCRVAVGIAEKGQSFSSPIRHLKLIELCK